METYYSDFDSMMKLGCDVFGNQEKFNLWLRSDILSFGNRKPIDMIINHDGLDKVLDELNRIQHGILC